MGLDAGRSLRTALCRMSGATSGAPANENAPTMDNGQQQPAHEEDCPLFMTKMPTRANAGLDALAAIIDEEEEQGAAAGADDDRGDASKAADVSDDPPVPPLPQRPMRKKRGIGTMQVALALTGLEPGATQTGHGAGGSTAKRSRR